MARVRARIASSLHRLQARRRLAVALLVAGCVGLLAAATALTVARYDSGALFAGAVESPDANLDELPDSLSNAMGVDPFEPTPAQAIPAGWIERYGLPLDDPQLASRVAPYPHPPESPDAYGPGGLPPDFRMTYAEVYAYGRPGTWNESRDGVWDSGLDPRSPYTPNATRVPYAWLVKHDLSPFDGALLDRAAPGSNVTWTVFQAYARGLDPRSADGDRDGLPDEKEIELGTDPRRASTTGSGVPDGWLHAHGLSALDPALPYQDIARRGMTVLETYLHSARLYPAETAAGGGLDPRRISTLGGPLPDAWLLRYGFDPRTPGIEARVLQSETLANVTANFTLLDAYGVNKPERWNESVNGPWWGGTNATKNDTDDDGLSDLREVFGWESYHSDPTRPDTDGDGLTDRHEHDGRVENVAFAPTNPATPDTDGDGLTDGEELGLVPYKGHALPPGLDPTTRDTIRQGLTDGFAADYWIRRYDECALRATYAWGPEPRPSVAEALFGDADAAACERLLPGKDLLGLGRPNVLTADVDGDGLLNGWEVDPRGYVTSKYPPRPGDPPRPATDPANPDTDGDGLPDGWEVQFGVAFADGHGWNLDPAKWSSFDDGVSDAEQDLDGDGTTWYSYKRLPSGVVATAHAFRATNLEEHQAGSNPNARSSDGDGIPDGWKIFWSQKYFGLSPQERGDVYPGAPGPLDVPDDRLPRMGEDGNLLLATTALQRVLLADDVNSTFPGCADHKTTITTLQNTRITVCAVTMRVPYDYRAVAENATNPYMEDSSGEGIPDAWKAAWAWLGRGQAARLSAALPGAALDIDEDGLTLLEEYQHATSPYRLDSDLGGAGDGQEVDLGLDPTDPADDAAGASQGLDSDGDGVPNVDEMGGFLNARGETVKTSPTDPDTDHDGLLDGRSLRNVLGRKLMLANATDAAILAAFEARGLVVVPAPDGSADVPGEQDAGTDPTRLSTSGSGVPDGWETVFGARISDPQERAERYAYGRPEWWDEARDGVWRWGLLGDEAASADHDRDGLSDLNGEDPVPYANPRNVLPRGDPLAPGLDAAERLLRSQAYGGGWRNVTVPLKLPEPPGRAQTSLALDPLPAKLVGNGSVRFTGTLRTLAGEPVRNATVLLSLNDPSLVMGVAITNETGAYNGSVLFAAAVPAPPGAAGVPVFGSLAGAKEHRNPVALVPPLGAAGNQTAFAWAYNASWLAPPRQAGNHTLPNGGKGPGFLGNASAGQGVTLVVPTEINVDLPPSAKVAATIQVNATLADAWGRPVPHAEVGIEDLGLHGRTDKAGVVLFNVTLPRVPGPVALRVSYNGTDALLPARGEKTLTLSLPTQMVAVPPPAPVAPGASFAIQGTLLAAGGQPVANATVQAGNLTATTTDRGEWRLVGTLPADISTPDHRVTIAYDGNASLDASSTTVTVRVLSSPRWIVTPVTADAGAVVTVAATLVDAAGRPLAGVPFVFSTSWGSSASGVTGPAGRAAVPVDLAAVPPGEARFTFRQTEAGAGPSAATQTLLVTTDTRLTVEEAVLVRGGPAFVRGALADAQGRPVAGHVVSVQARDVLRQVVTGSDGAFNATFALNASDPLGPAPVQASFAGSQDGVHRGSRAAFSGHVQDGVRLALAKPDLLATTPLLRGALTNLLGQPLADVDLDLGYLGLRSATVTDAAGGFTVALALPPDAPLGPHALAYAVQSRGDLRGGAASIVLSLKGSAAFDADVPPAILVGSDLTFPVVARDAAGATVPGLDVSATLDGQPVAASYAGGTLAIRVPKDLPLGDHKLVLSAASRLHLVPDLATTLRLQTPTQIAPGPATVVAGRVGFVPVVVSGPAGPVANATLSVAIAGRAPMQVQTDASGAAQIPVPPLLSRATARITFAGDGTHGPAIASVTVKTGPAPAPSYLGVLAVVAALLVIAGAVALWLTRRHRSRKGVAALVAKAARKLRAGEADLRILYSIYLEVVQLSGTTEEEADVLTFDEVLARVLGEPQARDDAAILNAAFNRAAYGGSRIADDELPAIAGALERLAHRIGAGPSPA